MDVAQAIRCEPGAQRHSAREGSRFLRRGRPRFLWDRPFQLMFTPWISEGGLQPSRLRLECALASVALMLIIETLAGHSFTVLVFALVVAASLCGRIGRPFVLGTAIVVVAAHAFVLGSVPASGWMTSVRVVIWGLEG